MKGVCELIKNAAFKKGMANYKKSAADTLRDGLLEYMRLCIEELLDVGLASRYFNHVTTRNIAPGTEQEFIAVNQLG